MKAVALIRWIAGMVAVMAAASDAWAAPDPPQRVVSMNLCTDQLAMLVAAPGQLVSVSYLGRDPVSSAMAEEAQAIPANHGLAEEIFLLKPDLVLAGTFTTRTTVSLLRRLGFEVEEFAPETTVGDARRNILRMGALLGRDETARAIIREFDAILARHQSSNGERPLAAPYYANSYTAGAGALISDLIDRAGFDNLGERLGLSGTAPLPLETLLVAAPDTLVLADEPPGVTARAQEVLAHPALSRSFSARERVRVPSRYTVCGTPLVAEALDILVGQRLDLQGAGR